MSKEPVNRYVRAVCHTSANSVDMSVDHVISMAPGAVLPQRATARTDGTDDSARPSTAAVRTEVRAYLRSKTSAVNVHLATADITVRCVSDATM